MFAEIARLLDKNPVMNRRNLGKLVVAEIATACGPSAEQQMDASINTFTTAKPDVSGWETYRTQEEGFASKLHLKLNIPSGWKIKPLVANPYQELTRASGTTESDKTDQRYFTTAMTLSTEEGVTPRIVIATGTSLVTERETEDAFFNDAVKRVKDISEKYPDFWNNIKVTDVKFPNMETKMLSYISNSGPGSGVWYDYLAIYQIILVRHQRVYEVFLQDSPDKVKQNIPFFKGVLESLEFLK